MNINDKENIAILVSRPNEFWVSRMQPFKVYLDCNEIGEIRMGEAHSFPAETGLHKIYFKADWVKSEEVPVYLDNSQSVVQITVSSFARNNKFLIFCLKYLFPTFGFLGIITIILHEYFLTGAITVVLFALLLLNGYKVFISQKNYFKICTTKN